MTSVTQRIKQVKQPRGGYVPITSFDKLTIPTEVQLHAEENIHASLIGTVVDYLTRFMSGTPARQAFKISLMGASNIGKGDYALQLLASVKGLDDVSVVNALRLVSFDVLYRAGRGAYREGAGSNPDVKTIENIKIMVGRSLLFFKVYGPVVLDGFDFEGAYTDIITIGDGDFLTSDTLWDFKVSVSEPNKNHTLQLLIYFIMGVYSTNSQFTNIKKLGIFNPRLNIVYTISTDEISSQTIRTVASEVIGYDI